MDSNNSHPVNKARDTRGSGTTLSEQIRAFREKKVTLREKLIEDTRATYAKSNRWGFRTRRLAAQ